ncbi:hypothetical protein M378DRAFT_160405 [Amanita muscaria Koide BX008]|uniref:Uncharacterized protein n=1 Tax=Amanita muscaria (strain Koide BX008) TaxID=946122 RepID=A0A0C2SU06_AMAMK|nr:hypothetical protein M378DRAFT_160405 [Amanita muscaria Koide BX008]
MSGDFSPDDQGAGIISCQLQSDSCALASARMFPCQSLATRKRYISSPPYELTIVSREKWKAESVERADMSKRVKRCAADASYLCRSGLTSICISEQCI